MIIIFNFHKQTVQVRGSRKRICEKLKAAKIINQNAVKFAAFRGELGCELRPRMCVTVCERRSVYKQRVSKLISLHVYRVVYRLA